MLGVMNVFCLMFVVRRRLCPLPPPFAARARACGTFARILPTHTFLRARARAHGGIYSYARRLLDFLAFATLRAANISVDYSHSILGGGVW